MRAGRLGPVSQLDRWLFCRIATTPHSRVGDRVLRAVSRAGDWSAVWFATAAALAVIGGRRGRRAALRGWFAILLNSTFFNHSVKLAIRRARPEVDPVPERRRPAKSTSTFSFPSGHTASAFAFATAVRDAYPRLSAVLTGFSVSMAYSRVHAGMHYPSDVVAGAAVGTAAGWLSGPVGRGLVVGWRAPANHRPAVGLRSGRPGEPPGTAPRVAPTAGEPAKDAL